MLRKTSAVEATSFSRTAKPAALIEKPSMVTVIPWALSENPSPAEVTNASPERVAVFGLTPALGPLITTLRVTGNGPVYEPALALMVSQAGLVRAALSVAVSLAAQAMASAF